MESVHQDRRTLVTAEAIDDISFHSHLSNGGRILKRITDFFKSITLEPCIFIYFLALSMGDAIFSEMVLQKTCSVSFNYSTLFCDNITQHKEELIDVQQQANRTLMINELIISLPTILFVLFLGSWSDKHGRKIPLILPFIGSILSSILKWMNAVLWDLAPEYILLTAIPSSLTGGTVCLMMSMYSYISDISQIKSRSVRIAFFDTFLILGSSSGILLSTVTKGTIGFSGTFIVVGCFHALAVIYIIIRIEETRGDHARNDLDGELVPKSNKKLQDLCNCDHVRQTFVTTFEKRPNHGRTKVIILMLSICAMVFAFSGIGKTYYYTKVKFQWVYEQYMHYFVVAIFTAFLGMAVIFPVLSFKLGIRDEFMGMIGCISVMSSYAIMAATTSGYGMYIGSVVGILSGVPLAISRSMISKVVPKEGSGKVFSVLASWESFLPLVAAPLYTYTYNSTLAVFPGAYFIVSLFAYIFSGAIYMGCIIVWLGGGMSWLFCVAAKNHSVHPTCGTT